MVNVLKQYFPMIRSRGEVLKDISGNERLWELYLSWKEEQQKEFLDFCTGIKGVKNFRMTPRVLQMKAPLLSWIL